MAKTSGEASASTGHWLPYQEKVERFYNSFATQVVVAALIGANFLTNILEKEIDAQGTRHVKVWDNLELFYNIAFTIELAINMYAHWFWNFWTDSWNIFDVIVVSIGLLNTFESMLKLNLPEAFSLLRMMRAGRVFRLFKRVHSLNRIIVAIAHAVPGVVNAFLILAILMSIFAIIAVEFYQELGNDCLIDGHHEAWLITPRQRCFGDEYFGKFSKSFYTFWQVLTGESWSEAVARPAIFDYWDSNASYAFQFYGGGMFFVLYVIIANYVITNLVVAILLDKFGDPDVDEKAKVESIEASGGDRNSSGEDIEEAIVVPTREEDLLERLDSVEEKVERLMDASQRMSSEVDTVRSKMESMREQVTAILQCVPGGDFEIICEQAFTGIPENNA